MERGILEPRGEKSYEITEKAIRHSAMFAAPELDIEATPQEILFHLLHTRRKPRPERCVADLPPEERRHLRIAATLANTLIAFGRIDPSETTGSVRDAVDRLATAGYLDHFGPRAYQLTEFALYSMCWDWRLSWTGRPTTPDKRRTTEPIRS